MKNILSSVILIILTQIFLNSIIYSQITIDGNFSDWNNISSYVTDSNSDNGGGNRDLIAGYYTVDATTLYLKTDVQGTFQPVDWTDNYIIYFDTDRSTSTGLTNGWWTMGADYRIVIFNSQQYLQVFMGSSNSDDSWGWGGTLGNSKAISTAWNGSSCESAVSFSDLGVNSSSSIWIQWRAEPGSDGMPEYGSTRSDAPLQQVQSSLKVLVPAYFGLYDDYWARLIAQSSKMPGQLYAIANISNGPGNLIENRFLTILNNMHSNQGKIIGYVYTQYGNRAIAQVKNDIDKWYQFYSSIDGIFLDEQPITSGKESYYMEIYNYIKQKNPKSLVVTNPGQNTIESYLFYNGQRIADVICVFEGNSGFDNWLPASWQKKYSKDNFYVLPFNTLENQYASRIDKAKNLNIGWIYCTDDTGDNPWDTLPFYFENFCNYIVSGIFIPMNNTNSKIKIDGHFSDWQKIIPINVSQGLAPSSYSDPSANIKKIFAIVDSSNLYLSLQLSAKFDYQKYFYHIFIDIDNDSPSSKTGFVYKDSASIGADFMLENNNFFKYTGTGGTNWSWAGFSGMQKADSLGRTEISIPLNTLSNNSFINVKFFIQINQAVSPYTLIATAPENYHTSYYTISKLLTKVDEVQLPSGFQLNQNYPNPFNPTTQISYSIPKSGIVNLRVYNIIGKEVAELINEYQNSGTYQITFNAQDLPSGVYFYQLKTGDYISSKKMLLIK
ncbi:spherulation-specific family 4 protein [Stygiobacter electus]|uniref:Spherulation-specific family 4 protein n=1 Tax=Stygiobacter electus TaxID=3032292 RepID=A0AAE3NXX5_9BACT|nr:spherulation-specific family 4 protein [Stygiobacter electus]MDF1610640.1 spherulation-specific family 4 protein [Stygiobacter electus]